MSADSMFTHISNSLVKQDPRPKIEKGKWICEQSSLSHKSVCICVVMGISAKSNINTRLLLKSTALQV